MHAVDTHELLDSEVVGHGRALKAPLLAQDLVEQPAIHVGRESVDFVVRGHDAGDPRFFDGRLERPDN